MTITIVGLGAGDIDDLTRKAWRVLKNAPVVYLRTARHGCVDCLPQRDTRYHAFDALYEANDDFEAVYNAIVDTLMDAAKSDDVVTSNDVVYAVPGDPTVGEATTAQIIARSRAAGIAVQIVHGVSFVEPSLAAIGVDALDGLQIYDGIDIARAHHPPLNPDFPALIGQVYSRFMASNIKLTLMNQYPDDFPVHLIHSAGTSAQTVEAVPLHDIDRSAAIGHTTSLFVPAVGGMTSFERFQDIIARLRDPEGGCPWDLKQTHESLRQYLLEETYEVLEAIDSGDTAELYRELGDLLLQVVLHTQIAIDSGEFMMTDVLRHINEKMIRRHPHVFSDTAVDSSEQVTANWDAIKAAEKAANQSADDAPESRLDGVPRALPALLRSLQYQDRAARAGFDWPVIDDVRAKLSEELDEVLSAPDDEARREELGDLLFVLVNWARWLGIDPENALRMANDKFYRRFRHVEKRVAEAGRQMNDMTLAELDVFWDEAKAQGL